MAVFIEAQTEPFERERHKMAGDLYARNEQPVRRPLRGIQIKENTYAIIRIMGADGQFIPVIDAAGETYIEQNGANYTTHYSNFMIHGVQEERHEKKQIIDTFGESYIFFFGEAPRMLRVSGILLNTADFNWRAEFWANYERYFRGTRLVEMGARLYLIYDDNIVEGYMVGATAQEKSMGASSIIQFSFQMFVTGHSDLSFLGGREFPEPTGYTGQYTELDSYSRALQIWQQNRNIQRELSTEAVAEANRSAYLGSTSMISSMIRSNIIAISNPSTAGFLNRAIQATRPSVSFSGGARNYEPYGNPAIEQDRYLPLRTTFRDNRDEFLGGSPSGSSPYGTKLSSNPFVSQPDSTMSQSDQWLHADNDFDDGVDSLVQPGTTVATASPPATYTLPKPTETQKFWDLMGRAGRAQAEIKEKGGHRAQGRKASGLAIGSGGPARSPIYAREVPFGMMTDPGELL